MVSSRLFLRTRLAFSRTRLITFLVLCTSCSGDPVVPEDKGEAGQDTSPTGDTDDTQDTQDTQDTDDTQDTQDTQDPVDTGWDPDGDSDGDGLTDTEEGRVDGDGSRNSDGDELPDYLDEDSDGDGISDAIEALERDADGAPADTDGDGIPDYLDEDSDGDDIPDLVEGAPDTGSGPPDTDGDGIPDYRDDDADGDGLTDLEEGVEDWDGDGVLNWRDATNDVTLPALNFVAISTPFNTPIGIDFHEYTTSVVLSVNYPSGNPWSLERVLRDGSHVQFSALSGLSNEVKIATARSGGAGGFAMGELFVGNGVDGQIVRISSDGTSIINPWVDLPGASNGLMRGSLYVDRTGVFGGDLIVSTTNGQIWRVDSAGTSTMLVDLHTHLEGMITVPDAPARYGPLAGRVIVGAEGVGQMFAVAVDGTTETYSLGVNVEDIDIVVPHENFFGVNYGSSVLLGVEADEFLPIAGDIILTQESHSNVGLYRLWWDGANLQVVELSSASGSPTIAQWEHTTFADAGIQEIPRD
jgi:hypothetical protein